MASSLCFSLLTGNITVANTFYCASSKCGHKCFHNRKVVGAILTHLSKLFDCLPCDLLISKSEVHGFDNSLLKPGLDVSGGWGM